MATQILLKRKWSDTAGDVLFGSIGCVIVCSFTYRIYQSWQRKQSRIYYNIIRQWLNLKALSIQCIPTIYYYYCPILTSNALLHLHARYLCTAQNSTYTTLKLTYKQLSIYSILHSLIYYGLPFIYQLIIPPTRMEMYQQNLFAILIENSYNSCKLNVSEQSLQVLNSLLKDKYNCSTDIASIIWEFVGETPIDPLFNVYLSDDLVIEHHDLSSAAYDISCKEYSRNPFSWRIFAGTNFDGEYHSDIIKFGQFCGWILLQAVSMRPLIKPGKQRGNILLNMWIMTRCPLFLALGDSNPFSPFNDWYFGQIEFV